MQAVMHRVWDRVWQWIWQQIWLVPLLVGLAVVLWLWGFGGMGLLERWAADGQRDTQNAMARIVRALRAGEPGAALGLLGLCFAYGFFHAAGPGHGKVLIGGYGLAQKVSLWRLSVLSVAASLAQALAAVLLVHGALWAFGWGRGQMETAAEGWFAPASYVAIGLVGLWLATRGSLRLWRARSRAVAVPLVHDHHHHHHDHAPDHTHGHAHDHAHDHNHAHGHAHDDDGGCGHAHGPTAEQVAGVNSVRDAIFLIGAIAIRPCTGAIFLLLITASMGIAGMGILGAFAMGLGTASVTLAVAVAATGLRESLVSQWGDGRSALRAGAALEIAAGAMVALVAFSLLQGAL